LVKGIVNTISKYPTHSFNPKLAFSTKSGITFYSLLANTILALYCVS